jgi:hypothetical protein
MNICTGDVPILETNKLTQDYIVLHPIKKCENIPVALHEYETGLSQLKRNIDVVCLRIGCLGEYVLDLGLKWKIYL